MPGGHVPRPSPGGLLQQPCVSCELPGLVEGPSCGSLLMDHACSTQLLKISLLALLDLEKYLWFSLMVIQ